MAASDSPNQMTAAGTQAIDGNDCRPVSSGPIAARNHRRRAMARPRAVPSTMDSANPMTPRCRLVQTTSTICPFSNRSMNACQTMAGDGRMSGRLTPDRNTNCQIPISTATATSGGSTDRRARIHHGVRCGAWASRASRPAPTAAVSSRSVGSASATDAAVASAPSACDPLVRGAGKVSGAGMAGDLLPQPHGDVRGQRRYLWVLDGPGPTDVHRPLADHPTGPGGQQYHPLAEPHGLAHVVGHEHHAGPGLFPDPGQRVVHDVPG